MDTMLVLVSILEYHQIADKAPINFLLFFPSFFSIPSFFFHSFFLISPPPPPPPPFYLPSFLLPPHFPSFFPSLYPRAPQELTLSKSYFFFCCCCCDTFSDTQNMGIIFCIYFISSIQSEWVMLDTFHFKLVSFKYFLHQS